MNKFVLDACAVLALLKEEEGMEVVKNVIDNEIDVFLHSVTFLEIYYTLTKELGIENANLFFELIQKTSIRIIYEINEGTIKNAGYFKANYRISLGDSFVLATAKTHNAKIVTSDHHEFDIIENSEKIDFLWIR